MKGFAALVVVAIATAPAFAADLDQVCPGGDGSTVRQVLEWCSRNSSGFNEGGLCWRPSTSW